MKIIFFLFLEFITLNVFCQGIGIKFQQGSFEEVKAAAAKQGKPIFLDVYTTWCGPCKKMTKEVFSIDEVGSYFNKHFVNYKVDAEKGEGIAIARQYKVSAYPTMLFLDVEGNIKHSMRGYRPYEPFLDEAKKVIDPSHKPELADRYMNDKAFRRLLDEERKQKIKLLQTLKLHADLDSLHNIYNNGNRKIDFLADYILSREKYKVTDPKVVNTYFEAKGKKKTVGLNHLAVQSLKLEYAYDPLFDQIANEAFERKNNSATVDPFNLLVIQNQIKKAFNTSWESAMTNKDTTAISSLMDKQNQYLQLTDLSNEEKEQEKVNAKLLFYRSTGMARPYHTTAQPIIHQLFKSSDKADSIHLIEFSSRIADLLSGYEKLNLDKSEWEVLLKQSKKNLEVYKHPDTYAPVLLMYHRLGMNNEAMTWLREGMIYGKKEKLDTQKLFKLFSRIKKSQG
jgi:thioredoxin-related protein